MLETLWRWQARHRGGGFDWLFLGFVLFSAVMIAWLQVKVRKQRMALFDFQTCMARAEAPCAGSAIERLRSLGFDPVRTRVARASVDVLLGRLPEARTALDAIGTPDKLGPVARGELLLARGDLALAEREPAAARESYAAARTLVDPGVVEQRLTRVADFESKRAEERAQTEAIIQANAEVARRVRQDARANAESTARSLVRAQEDRASSAADQLRSVFGEAVTAIQDGKIDKARLLLADARRLTSALRYDAQGKAQLALQAAERAATAVQRREGVRAALRMDSAALLGQSDEAQQKYRQAMQERLRQMETEAQQTLDETLPMARRFLDEALAIASSPSGATPAYRGGLR